MDISLSMKTNVWIRHAIFKSYCSNASKQIFELAKKLNHSKDPWQRRLSLVMVEWYTRKGETHKEIKELVRNLENDKGYYVKKAVVWMKRNFKKGK